MKAPQVKSTIGSDEAMPKTVQTTSWLPWWWNLGIALGLLVGLALLYTGRPYPSLASRLNTHVPEGRWITLVGILIVATTLSHTISTILRRGTRSLLRLTGDTTPADTWSPALVGVCESIMYPLALFADKGEFIGIWLAIKVAGQWVRWAGNAAPTVDESTESMNEGRRRFNAFLVGNAVSIMLGSATWIALKVWIEP